MAALHDGQQFLVERYEIATIPTLSLTATSSLNPQQIRALLAGLTQRTTVGGRPFEALEYVDDEVEAIREQVQSAQLLLDQSFNLQQLKTELTTNQYSVLHIATHGQFGAEPEDTFLVTGQGEKLTLAQMERLIRGMSDNAEPIDLLALTACETAIGDERAALGLGGVAIRAGAKSAIASLWAINDATTAELIADFYRGFVSGQLSKAKALQTAQIKLIQENRHPGFWAPYVLVGNWR
jgi:CHAT domain-containing protein